MSESPKRERFADDGYINLPASLGEASPLQSSGDYVRNNITSQYELLTVLYRENWIAKRIIDMPCEDMTREWYSISTELKQNLIDKIKKIEAKHNVKAEITSALKWARLYGGSLALIVLKGQEDMLDEELDYGMIMPGSFKGLLVLDKVTGISPSIELVEDMDDPDFNLPMYYDVPIEAYGGRSIRVHHSRVLRFIGRELPPQEEILENYWGASELEHMYEELQKRNATSANIAQLVFQANIRTMKMADFGEVFGTGNNKNIQEAQKTIEAQNRLMTSFGLHLIGKDDTVETHPYTFSGVSDVYESFMLDMAGAAGIPATKLFGRAPQGMNATGESDMKNYYESISQLQERQLRPALEKLLPVMCMSVFGAIPNDMEIVFEPIDTVGPEQRAQIMSQFTGTIVDAMSGGLIGRKTALEELREQGKEIGAWTKISDQTIEEADDEVDNGEMGGGEMPPNGGMMPGGEEEPQEEMPEQPPAQPEEVPENFQKPGMSDSEFIDDFNENHGPDGKFAEGGNHSQPKEIQDAVKRAISSGFRSGINRKGQSRHQNKRAAEMASEAEYRDNVKRYEKAKARGKDMPQPIKRTKSYFEGVSGDFILQKALGAIDKGSCKWYSKAGGENKAQVTFNKDLGYTVERSSGKMIPTRTVTVTYSRENGFHCYPDEKR